MNLKWPAKGLLSLIAFQNRESAGHRSKGTLLKRIPILSLQNQVQGIGHLNMILPGALPWIMLPGSILYFGALLWDRPEIKQFSVKGAVDKRRGKKKSF